MLQMRTSFLFGVCLALAAGTYACSDDSESPPRDETTGGSSGRGGGNSAGAIALGGNAFAAAGGSRPAGGDSGFSMSGASGGVGVTAGAGSGALAGAAHPTGGATAGAGDIGAAGDAANPFSGGATGVAGRGNVAGTSALSGMSGGGAGAGAGDAGSAAIGGENSAGATSSPGGGPSSEVPVDCSALCSGSACSVQPPCLQDAFGIRAGQTLEICVPSTNILGGIAKLCENTTCDGGAGCPMTVEFGDATWEVTPGLGVRTADVALDTVITSLTGPIGVSGSVLNCELTAVLPSGGLPVVAFGAAAPSGTEASGMALSFDRVQAPLTGLSVASDHSTCQDQANNNLSSALPSLRTALLDAINARAQNLACLDCRGGDCPEGLACVAF